MVDKPPNVLEPTDPSSGRPATFIFLHGLGDDGEGLPQGLAQQFQWHNKLPYLRWLVPNAPHDLDAMQRAWYMPRALPNALKPSVPDQPEESENTPDDEIGILRSCHTIDQLVEQEVERGVDPKRIVVGGFSQGCAVSLVWGLTSQGAQKVGGVVCLSGYFPMADKIPELRKDNGLDNDDKCKKSCKKWFYIHGSKDVLVPLSLFEQGKEQLKKYVKEEDVEEHTYEGLGHSAGGPLLRHLLLWLERIVPV